MPKLKPSQAGRVASAQVSEATPESDQTDVLYQAQEAEPEEVVLAPEEDPSLAFQKQIDSLRKSEQAQRERAEQAVQEREQAIQRAKDRETEVTQLKKQTADSQVEAVSSALAAATADADAAQRDIAAAVEIGDIQAQAAAYRRMVRAETSIARLEDGKAELEERSKAPPEQPEKPPQQQGAELPQRAKNWLIEHPEYMNDSVKNAVINLWHHQALKKGLDAYSVEYMEFINDKHNAATAPQDQSDVDEPEVRQQPQQRASLVSAPVSREVPSSSGSGLKPGQIRLSAQQKEAAKITGVTEAEYAKQIIRLQQEKANGNYNT